MILRVLTHNLFWGWEERTKILEKSAHVCTFWENAIVKINQTSLILLSIQRFHFWLLIYWLNTIPESYQLISKACTWNTVLFYLANQTPAVGKRNDRAFRLLNSTLLYDFCVKRFLKIDAYVLKKCLAYLQSKRGKFYHQDGKHC